MIDIRRSDDRHHENFGWLDTKWSFSFDSYYDPAHVSLGPLRVLNEDFIHPGTGFPLHGHQDMEILTFLLKGSIQHEDSLGNKTVIRADEIQRMTAGTGIQHSERNPSSTEVTRLLQVWIMPERRSLTPSYEQRAFSPEERANRLLPVVSSISHASALTIHQDMTAYVATLHSGRSVAHKFALGRRGYLFVAEGSIEVNRMALETGDAAKISGEAEIAICAATNAQVLLFDLP